MSEPMHEVRITNKATGHSWVNPVYCATMAEAVALMQASFSARIYEVAPANAPVAPPAVKPAVQEDLF